MRTMSQSYACSGLGRPGMGPWVGKKHIYWLITISGDLPLLLKK